VEPAGDADQNQDSQKESDAAQSLANQSKGDSKNKLAEESSEGELTAANEKNESESDPPKRALMAPRDREGMMTREEALKLLQAVRDRDMLRRLQQRRRQRSRRLSVEKDW
jgi:Ca-activated chloride channel family protein